MKKGFLPMSTSSSSTDNTDTSVLFSEKMSDVKSTWSSEKLLVSDAYCRSSSSDASNVHFILCVFISHEPLLFIAEAFRNSVIKHESEQSENQDMLKLDDLKWRCAKVLSNQRHRNRESQ